MKRKLDYEIGSENVFADLNLPDAQEMPIKADIAYEINNLIRKKKLNQTQAAKLLGIDQPKISALNSGKLSGFSLERLFRFLNILEADITIKIMPKKRSKKKANITVTVPTITKIKQMPQHKPNHSDSTRTIQAKKKQAKKN